jgi:enoyl-CoA hydratase/carnithine racemase
LNRPEKLNALSPALLEEFTQALDAINDDQDINVLIVTGAGRAFSSGFDIAPGRHRPDAPVTANWDATHLAPRSVMKLWNMRQPTITAVNGFALAAGNVLALAADIVIASEQAQFGEPEIRHVVLDQVCPACGAVIPAERKFCGMCGHTLAVTPRPAPTSAPLPSQLLRQ